MATDCSELIDPGFGVSAEFYQEECRAEEAMKYGNYHAAANHYSNALSIQFHEAPNYRLRLPLAKALCLGGKKELGFSNTRRFELMAKADLGELECPNDWDVKKSSEHEHLACVGFGSSLNQKGKESLEQQLKQVETIKSVCENA